MTRDDQRLGALRLQRGNVIAGLAAEQARAFVKHCHGGWTNTERIAYLCKVTDAKAAAALMALRDSGYLEQRVHGDVSGDGWAEWTTTVAGAALAMASFAKPVSRAKAETLL